MTGAVDPWGNQLGYDAHYDDRGTGRDSTPGDVSLTDTPPDQGKRNPRDNGDSRDRGTRRTAWTAVELMATEFPEPRWAVPEVIPEGATLFAGPPKVGKSWLSLGLAVAVAAGGKALGRIDVDPGPCLYLALEDTPRRLKARLATILQGDPAPAELTIAVECPPLPMGGEERIGAWLDAHRDARLVIIDVFTRVRGPKFKDDAAYDADYRAVAQAKAIADAYGVAVLLVAHTRKAMSDDWVDLISGTLGLSGAADSIAVLKRMRGKADGILSIVGRDVDEAEHALTFAADIGAWQLSNTPAALVKLTDTQRLILTYLAEHEDGAGPKQVADDTGLDYEATKKAMRRMVPDGDLITDGHGRYWAPVTRTPVPDVPDVPTPPLTSENTGDNTGGTLSLPVPDDQEAGE